MRHIEIGLAEQILLLYERDAVIARYPVSTARNGPGQQRGSECTPLGRHYVRAKIGAGRPAGTVFVARRPTGEIWDPDMQARCPGRDWILSRILWLSGLERGHNRLGTVDTMQRYIYIHGSPEPELGLGPSSHGCIRMRNADVIELFDAVAPGTVVDVLVSADAARRGSGRGGNA